VNQYLRSPRLSRPPALLPILTARRSLLCQCCGTRTLRHPAGGAEDAVHHDGAAMVFIVRRRMAAQASRDPVSNGAEIILRLRREVNLQGRDRARLYLRGLARHGHSPAQVRV
jgi:hypothetical protein